MYCTLFFEFLRSVTTYRTRCYTFLYIQKHTLLSKKFRRHSECKFQDVSGLRKILAADAPMYTGAGAPVHQRTCVYIYICTYVHGWIHEYPSRERGAADQKKLTRQNRPVKTDQPKKSRPTQRPPKDQKQPAKRPERATGKTEEKTPQERHRSPPETVRRKSPPKPTGKSQPEQTEEKPPHPYPTPSPATISPR